MKFGGLKYFLPWNNIKSVTNSRAQGREAPDGTAWKIAKEL